jgi:hypothetical protein
MNTLSYKIESKEYIFEIVINETKKPEVILSAKDNNKILWKTIFENTIIEEIKLFYKIKRELYCVINNVINKININNGNIVKKNTFGNTSIKKIILNKKLCIYYCIITNLIKKNIYQTFYV